MIDWKVNFDGISDLIGTVYGLDNTMQSNDYMDKLAEAAHNEASLEFDLALSATAGAGYLTHVYEYGVSGITRGPVRFSDPTEEDARLYVHDIAGHSGNYGINYVFRPAIVRNPQPTTTHTGVPSKYLRKLSKRKYVFSQKAMVMETGMEVSIKPQGGRTFLFVPFYREVDPRNPLNKRGYMMWFYPKFGPITTTPGRDTKGSFNAFWETWWGETGRATMDRGVQRSVTTDVKEVLRLSASRARSERPEPVMMSKPSASVRAAKKKTEALMNKKSKMRGSRKRR